MSEGVSQGIRDCHRLGIVTSTTAMMNLPGVETALSQALRECPRLGLGVHLVLTAGRPLLPASRVASLLLKNGMFPDEEGMIPRLSQIDPEQVRAEWNAQVDRFVSVTGREPDHLDSHHHISFLSTAAFEIMAEIASAHRTPIRFPEAEVAADMLSDFPPIEAKLTIEANMILARRHRLTHPDHLNRTFYGENATLTVLLGVLENLPSGSTEIMCHPAIVDPELRQNSVYNEGRALEYDILTGEKVLETIRAKKIELIGFQELSPAGWAVHSS